MSALRVSPAGVVLAVAGALAAIVSVFLPLVRQRDALTPVASNSLIESAAGTSISARVAFLAVCVLAFTLTYHRNGQAGPGVVLLGLALLTGAFIDARNSDLTTLYPVDSGELRESYGTAQAKLAVALYVTGAGGALAAIGGVLMQKDMRGPDAAPAASASLPDAATSKACPDCAESVLVAARVCKHCGLRFGAD